MAIQTLSGELYNKEEVESIKTELTEKIDTIIITGGGVSPTVFEETVTRLEETDSTINAAILALQETDATINDRVAALEAGGGSGGSTTDLTVVNERLTALEAEDVDTIARVEALENKDLTLTDNITALQETDTALGQRVTALEAGGGSGGNIEEIITMNISVDTDKFFDASTWVLLDSINFDTLYQSYLAKTNKPVVINIGMATDTGATQYSFRDVITSAEDTQIRITGDAMSAAIAPNIRFAIDLVLIKDEITGNCIIDTEQSKMFMAEEGGSSGEAVPEKIFEFTGEYLVDTSTADEPDFTVNIDAIDSDKFKEAVDDNYKFQLYLRAPQTQLPIVITTYMYALQTPNYVFLFNLDSVGIISDAMYGRVQIGVMQNEDTGNYELGPYSVDKGDDDSLNLITLDKRVTALEENGSGGSTDDLSSYTYIIDSQEKFDALVNDSHSKVQSANDYTKVYIKAGTYKFNKPTGSTKKSGILLGNDVNPISSITGENTTTTIIEITGYAFIGTFYTNIAEYQDDITKNQNNYIQNLTIKKDLKTYKDPNSTIGMDTFEGCINIKNCNVILIDDDDFSMTKDGGSVFDRCYNITNCHVIMPEYGLIAKHYNDELYATFKDCHELYNCTTTTIKPTMATDNYTTNQYTRNVGFYGCSDLVKCTCYTYSYSCGFTQCNNLLHCETRLCTNSNIANPQETASKNHIYYGYAFCTQLVYCNTVFGSSTFYSFIYKHPLAICCYYMCDTLSNCTLKYRPEYIGGKENLLTIKAKESASHTTKLDLVVFSSCKRLVNCNIAPLNLRFVTYISTEGTADLGKINVYENCNALTNCSIFPTKDLAIKPTFYLPLRLNIINDPDNTTNNTSNLTSVQFTLNGFIQCNNMLNCTVDEITYSTEIKDVTSDLYTVTYTSLKNATGVHNCVLYSPDTATCSASQTYVADYAVADTPAGGFNKIVS